MACSSCRQLDVTQLQSMSDTQLIDLYTRGYKLAEDFKLPDNRKYDVKSMALEDVGVLQYFFFGLWSYLSYKSYETEHNIWAILFGALALGSFGGIVGNLKK